MTRRSLFRFLVTLMARLGIWVAILMLFFTTPRLRRMVTAWVGLDVSSVLSWAGSFYACLTSFCACLGAFASDLVAVA
jgi:hypothetical protein